MPLSGGNRKHYARELARTERLHADLVKRTRRLSGRAISWGARNGTPDNSSVARPSRRLLSATLLTLAAPCSKSSAAPVVIAIA